MEYTYLIWKAISIENKIETQYWHLGCRQAIIEMKRQYNFVVSHLKVVIGEVMSNDCC